jgi:hypothetical protein
MREMALARSYDTPKLQSRDSDCPYAVAETLAKMYRIAFGIFSPPISNWAEDEAHLV